MSTTTTAEATPINLTEDGGVQKRIIKAGEGPQPPAGAGVTAHYEARLAGASVPFDSSRGRELPFRFKLGAGRVIKGWDIALASMRRGEVAEVTIAPAYAYGDSTEVPNVPPGSTLVYEIELLGWDERVDASPHRDKTITKEVENYGNGLEMPLDGATVTIDYTVYEHTGTDAEAPMSEQTRTDYTFTLGDFQTQNLALEAAVLSMRLNEHSRFYFAEHCPDLPSGWAASNGVSVEIVLKALQNAPSVYTLGGPEEVIAEAERLKALGNELYKEKNARLAIRRYKRAVELLDKVRKPKPTPEQKERINALKTTCFLNVAAAALFAKEYRDAAEACANALKLSPKNEKALLRRAKAFKAIERWDDAITDLNAVLEITPENEEAKKLLAASKRGLAIFNKKQNERYKGMFDKF